jgi:hypothetical protein
MTDHEQMLLRLGVQPEAGATPPVPPETANSPPAVRPATAGHLGRVRKDVLARLDEVETVAQDVKYNQRTIAVGLLGEIDALNAKIDSMRREIRRMAAPKPSRRQR